MWRVKNLLYAQLLLWAFTIIIITLPCLLDSTLHQPQECELKLVVSLWVVLVLNLRQIPISPWKDSVYLLPSLVILQLSSSNMKIYSFHYFILSWSSSSPLEFFSEQHISKYKMTRIFHPFRQFIVIFCFVVPPKNHCFPSCMKIMSFQNLGLTPCLSGDLKV